MTPTNQATEKIHTLKQVGKGETHSHNKSLNTVQYNQEGTSKSSLRIKVFMYLYSLYKAEIICDPLPYSVISRKNQMNIQK